MVKRQQRTSRFRKRKPLRLELKEPDYKNADELANFLSDRGKILSRAKTGVSQKYQRKLEKAIKRARHLALLPFAPKV